MDNTLAQKLKKQQQYISGIPQDPNAPQPDPNAPAQGMGDQKYAEMAGQAQAADQQAAASAPESEMEAQPHSQTDDSNDDESKLSTADMQDPQKLANKLRGSQVYTQQLRALAEDPKYAAKAPPQTQADLKSAIDRAQQMYSERTNRNDWLDIAQNLTRAVTQYAAAQGAHPGQNMALSFAPGTDYGARNEQAYRAMEGQIGGAKSLAEVTRQNALDTSDVANKEYAKKAGALTESAKIEEQKERDEDQFNRSMMQEKYRFDRETLRDKVRDKNADKRDQRTMDAANLKDLDQQEKELNTKLQAAQTLRNNMSNDSDISSKGKEKLAEQYGALAGKADIDPSQLADIADKSKDKGVLGTGFFQSEDPAKKQQLMNQQIVAPIKNLLDQVHANKQKILQKNSQKNTPVPGSPPNSPAPQQNATAPAGGTVRIQGPSGQIAELPADKAQKYLSMPGYTQVK